MIKPIIFLSIAFALFNIETASARNDVLRLPIASAMQSEAFQTRLGTDVRFYWGDEPTPAIAQKFGEFPSNMKTNAFNKNDMEACEWVLLLVLISLHDRALREGGNAVINIKSNYKSHEFISSTEYECGAGAILAGVALTGTVVKLDQ